MDAAFERSRRLELWHSLAILDLNNLEPSELRKHAVYGGAQGIWVDKARTSPLTVDGYGATVAILHTGRHYPDDLSDEGLIYHYPQTGRGSGRDRAEVQVTKNAMLLSLPIFVILPGQLSTSKRMLKLGWVVDHDDDARQFLILFGSGDRPMYISALPPEGPFMLEDNQSRRPRSVLARPGQQRFRFQVVANYGCKCAVCEIAHPALLQAAHLRGKRDRGSDDWRNGLPLCPTHHAAFDGHLFGIEPDMYKVRCRAGIEAGQLGLRTAQLATAKNLPHIDAVAWRWSATLRAWTIQGNSCTFAQLQQGDGVGVNGPKT